MDGEDNKWKTSKKEIHDGSRTLIKTLKTTSVKWLVTPTWSETSAIEKWKVKKET